MKAKAGSKVKEYLQETGLWRYHQDVSVHAQPGTAAAACSRGPACYDCKVLVCDEPTYAQDVRSLKSVMKLMMDRVRRKRTDASVFFHADKQLARITRIYSIRLRMEC